MKSSRAVFAAVAAATLAASGAFAQSAPPAAILSERTDSPAPRPLSGRLVVDDRSTVLVKIAPDAVARPTDPALLSALRDATEVAKLAGAGLDSTRAYLQSTDSPNPGQMAAAVLAILNRPDLASSPIVSAIKTRYNERVIADAGAFTSVRSYQLFFEVAQEIAAERSAAAKSRLDAITRKVGVRFTLKRDRSSTPMQIVDTPFAALTPDETAALGALKKAAAAIGGTTNDPLGGIGRALLASVQAKAKVVGATRLVEYAGIKKALNDAIAAVDIDPAFAPLKSEFASIQALIAAINTDASELINFPAPADGDYGAYTDRALRKLSDLAIRLRAVRSSATKISRIQATLSPAVASDPTRAKVNALVNAIDRAVPPESLEENLTVILSPLVGTLRAIGAIRGSLTVIFDSFEAVTDLSKPIEYPLIERGARMGDRLEIRVVSVVDGRETPLSDNARFVLHVARIGSYYARTPLLIFAQGRRESAWRPTASLTTLYRHGTYANPAGHTLPWIRGSVGVNVGAFDFNRDDQYNPGFALTVTALDDLLHFGYGYTPQEKKPYVFFGLRLAIGL